MISSLMNQMLDAIAELGRSYIDLPLKKQTLKTVENLCKKLLERRGEASGTALAKEIVKVFMLMKYDDKVKFLKMLNDSLSPDPTTILAAAKDYKNNQSFENLSKLGHVTESPRLGLLRLINFAPGGTAAMILMREIIHKEMKNGLDLAPLDADLFHLFSSWFNRGFLQFYEINWDTPAVILEKLIAYEAVHEIKGWKDLRRRLADDRRGFAFFHPALPKEPVIFVEVAFTKGIAEKIQPLLSLKKSKPKTVPDSAIFYSISNCQKGLKGISFGNFLIKQVADHISKEIPNIKIFSTLSPIPKFRKWLETIYLERKSIIFTQDELKLMVKPDWFMSKSVRKKLKPSLVRLCAQYLTQESQANQPFDPVTRFHLGNGAEIVNINWDADISERGLSQSIGLMVNYRYNPAKIVSNHEMYINNGKIAYSSKVKKMLD